MFINQLFLVYLIGFHALKGFFPDFAMKLILASLAKWIKKHCQWESRIETSWNCLDRETEDALEKILAYIKTNLLLQQQSSTLSHVKLVDIGRKGKTWVKADSPCPELSSEMPGEPAADLPSVQMPEVCKGLRGGHQYGVEAGMQCPTTSRSLQSGPPVASLTKKQSSSEARAATPTYTLEWLTYTGASLVAHVNVLGVPSPSFSYRAKIQIARSNLSLLILLFGKFISKIPFIPWLWSTLLTHMLVQGGWNHWGCMGQWKRIRSPRGRLIPTCTDWTTGVNLKWWNWAELSTRADTLALLRVQRGLQCFNKTCVGPHVDMQAPQIWIKYCCLGFPGGSPYKDRTLVCRTYLCNGLSLRADLARRILCSPSSKIHKPKDILTSEPFLPSNIIFWHRAGANNTSLRIDNFRFCRCRSSGGSDSSGGWW